MRRILLLAFSLFLILIGWEAYGQTQTITTPGDNTFTVPAGVTSITVEVWGAGGRGGSRSSTNGASAGGGGGAYSRRVLTVTPGQVINLYVGFGSKTEVSGEDSWFSSNTTVMAKGGNSVDTNVTTGATGGSAAAGFGTVTFSGGNGANSGTDGGGGGSSAGIAASGNSTTTFTGATAPTSGGNGGNGKTGGQGRGDDGASPGGGGGGSRRSNASGTEQVGGYGGNGQIRISYIALASAVGTDSQSVCITTPITTTTYSFPPGSSVSLTNLPAGLTSNPNSVAGTLTISGTPTSSGTYTITVTPSYFSSIPLTLTRTGSVTVIPNNTVSSTTPNQARCINTALTPITHTTTGATGIGAATGLPAGVTAIWAANTITISGTPTASGTFNYSIPLTGGCGSINATGTITVTPDNTVAVPSSTPTLCINTTLTNITHITTGATGIGAATGLPVGLIAAWAGNTITISGTPTESGTFNYSIPLTGGCGAVNAIGTITVTPDNTTSAPSSTPTVCINTALTNITHTTTGATGIGVVIGLPAGVTANWASNTITISGTPTASGTFNYTIPLTGGCGTINATGSITVTPDNTVSGPSSTPTLCINTPLSDITHSTTGATGITNAGVSGANGLPAGLSATWTAGVVAISGTPTQAGTFNYSVPLTGGCLVLFAEGTITVNPATAITVQNMADQRICDGASFSDLSITATGVGTLSYQWFTNDNPSKTGATPVGTDSNTLPLPSDVIGTKYYYVEVTSGCSPIATSSFSQATVEPITAITTQPSTANDVECFGDGFDPIGIVAEGADLTYQWYSNTSQLNTGGTLIPESTSSSFTPPSTANQNIPYYYYVVVTGYCNEVTSDPSGEYIVTPPITQITQNPSGVNETTCKDGAFPELVVAAIGETDASFPDILYQWYSNTSPSNTGGTLIPGATLPNFTPSSNTVGIRYYYATAASKCGTVPTAVSGAFEATPWTDIQTENLNTQVICEGESFTNISVNAIGTGTLTYQWYSNLLAEADTLGAGTIELVGENSSTFTPPASAVGTLYYFVKVGSNCGPKVLSNPSGAFTINPLPTPTFTNEPTLPICVGQSATYTTEAGQSNYVWSGFGTAGTDFTITSGGIGLSNNSVTVTWLTSGAKNISASYTDPNNCTAAVPATNSLTVYALPVPTFTTYPSAPVCTGSSVTYTTQSGAGESNYVWSVPGVAGTDFNITSGGIGSTDPTVTITWLTSGAKDVSVSYTNANGCVPTAPVTNSLIVNSPPIPTFTAAPDTEVCLQDGTTYTTQSGKSNYQWTITGTPGVDYTIISGGAGVSNETVTIGWLTTGSKTVTVTYTEPSTGCIATSSASSTTEVEPNATVGPTSNSFPSVCISNPVLVPFTQPTTGVIGIGTPIGLPPGITASFNPTTGIIEFSGIVSGTSTGLYSYTIPLLGNCISGLEATGSIDFTPNYELTSVSAVSATVSGGSARIRINGTASNLPNGEYIATYILDDGTPPAEEHTSNSFIVSNGTGVFPTIPLTDLDVEVYKITIKSIKKVTDVCEVLQDESDPDNIAYFSVCGATFDQNGTFTVPAGIYEITIQAAGAGAAGQTGLVTMSVIPGESLGVFVGQSAGSGSARDTYVTRDSSLPNPASTSLIYTLGGGAAGPNGAVIITYTCPDPNKDDCIEVIDDGAKSGTTVIRFNCDDTWDIPEGLIDFSVFAIGGGGGGGMGSTAGGGGGGGIASTSVASTSPFGIPAGNSLNIKVGIGGPGAPTVNIRGISGGNSEVTANIPDPGGNININLNALGGGGGGSFNNRDGKDGASGGGGAYSDQATNLPGLGGAGTPGQGNNGGNGGKGNGANHARAGGGGGGAGGSGGVGDGAGVGLSKPGDGGDGSSFALSGSTYGYGAGGGGIGYNFNGDSDRQGEGGEVNEVILGGTASRDGVGGDGTSYTGSGGGAGRLGGGRGGSGVVYITYLNYRILEVEYQYFNANYNPQNRSGELTWATTKEWENSHFEIERAVNDVKTWTKIGEVNGQGYSDTIVEYEFTDLDLPAAGGNIFYRLKQVDMDGDSSYSVTRSIQVNALDGTTSWIAYPNPSDMGSSVTVGLLDDSGSTDGTIQIRVSDVRGVYQTYTVQNPEDVSAAVNSYFENARPGMYIVQLFWGNKSEQLKLIRR